MNQKNSFYSEDHEEIKIVPYIFVPFNCPLPASKGFLRVYCFEFNLKPFDLCVELESTTRCAYEFQM